MKAGGRIWKNFTKTLQAKFLGKDKRKFARLALPSHRIWLLLHLPFRKGKTLKLETTYKLTMDITGRIIAVMEKRSGQSQRSGNAWASQDYVIETLEQYPRRCVFNVFGEDKINEYNLQIGSEVTVSFDINAREYNGRWYNDIRAWRVVPAQAAPAPAAPAAPFAAPEATIPAPQAAPAAPEDDLPF